MFPCNAKFVYPNTPPFQASVPVHFSVSTIYECSIYGAFLKLCPLSNYDMNVTKMQ